MPPLLVQMDLLGKEMCRWTLPVGGSRLGRAASCAIRLKDAGVSGEHGLVEVLEGGRVAYRDLGSTNGSLVNEFPVRCLFLRDGDRLRVGATTLVFCEEDAEGKFAGSEAVLIAGGGKAPAPAAYTSEMIPPVTSVLGNRPALAMS